MTTEPGYIEIYKLIIAGLGSIILILLSGLAFFLIHYFKTVPIFAQLSASIDGLKVELSLFHTNSTDDAVVIHQTLKEHSDTLNCHEKEIVRLKSGSRRKIA